MKYNSAIKIFSTIIVVILLTSCVKSEFIDLSVFLDNFNSTESEYSLSYGDFFVTEKEGKTVYVTYFSENEKDVLLRLTANEEKKIESCNISAVKADSNGNEAEIDEETMELFINIAKITITAFTDCETDSAKDLIDEFSLSDISSFHEKGELTKKDGSFFYVYYSDSLISKFTVYNKWLHEIEETEKPESKPAFNDTTNIRTDTVPHT